MIDFIAELPSPFRVFLVVTFVFVVILGVPAIKSFNAWRLTRAQARKINAETDMQLIQEYKEFLNQQKKEIARLKEDNQRLHQVTNDLIGEAGILHEFLERSVDLLREAGVDTRDIPAVPQLRTVNLDDH